MDEAPRVDVEELKRRLDAGEQVASARVAQRLVDNRYRAAALRGGFEAWEQAGFPLEPK